jgi:hypothetical protein
MFLVLSSRRNRGTKAKNPKKNKSRGGQANQNRIAGDKTYKINRILFFVISSDH